jgi:hypothetical protein
MIFSALEAALATPLAADGTVTEGDGVEGGGQHKQ